MERMATKMLCLFWVALLATTTTVKAGNLEGCEEDNGQMKEANPDVAAADEVFFSQVETVINGDKATIMYPKGPNGTRLFFLLLS